MQDDKLVSVGEAARMLGLSVTTMRRKDESGEFPADGRNRAGRRVYRYARVLRAATEGTAGSVLVYTGAQDVCRRGDEALQGESDARAIWSEATEPGSDSDAGERLLDAMLDDMVTRVRIYQPHMLPPDQLARIVQFAMNRGIAVEITPNPPVLDSGLPTAD